MSELTTLDLLTLAALADQARYGYELVQRIEELTDARISIRPGNLYRVLHRLMERGLVVETETARVAGADERRRYFRTTARGRKVAAEELAMYQRVLKRTPALKELLSNV
ncbi:MAG: PadR family transcriptional regulator [Longimicrobiales bacterium]